MKTKIIIVSGTRAEYGLLKSVIFRIRKSKKLSLCLVITGMHTLKKYGSTIKNIQKDGVKINHIIPIGENDDMLSALSKEIIGLKKVFLKEKPRGILILGDRNEPFAAAIVGSHLQIPVFHIHGGDVSGFSIDEYIRHAITKFSHLHFTASKKSYNRVLKLGEESWRVFKVGAPGLDELRTMKYISRSILAKNLNLDLNKNWYLIIQHPVVWEKTPLKNQILNTLEVLKNTPGQKILIYPNNDLGSKEYILEIEKYRKVKDFRIFKNLNRQTYLSLLKNSNVLIGNSSSGIIEAGYFYLPVINIGNRQLGRERGKNVIDSSYEQGEINRALKKINTKEFKRRCRKTINPYGHGQAGEKIVDFIEKNINKSDLFFKKFTHQ